MQEGEAHRKLNPDLGRLSFPNPALLLNTLEEEQGRTHPPIECFLATTPAHLVHTPIEVLKAFEDRCRRIKGLLTFLRQTIR